MIHYSHRSKVGPAEIERDESFFIWHKVDPNFAIMYDRAPREFLLSKDIDVVLLHELLLEQSISIYQSAGTGKFATPTRHLNFHFAL